MLGNASTARNASLEAYPARYLNVLPAVLNIDQFGAGSGSALWLKVED